jgi:hypothetical protein
MVIMKKVIPRAIVPLFLVFILTAVSCAGSPGGEAALSRGKADLSTGGNKKNGRARSYALRDFKVSVPLAPERGNGEPRLAITLDLLEVHEPEQLARFCNDLLYGGNSPEQYRDALVREYRDMYRQIPEAAIAGYPPSAGWEHWESVTVSLFRNRGLVLGQERYSYAGGAHGTQTKKYYVVDLETLRVLTPADFFREPEDPGLRGLIIEELRRHSGLAPGRPLSEGVFFEDEPPVSANFFVAEDGLGMRWDPFEIAPYSEGGIEITLPWKTIRPLLKIEAMELLAEFGIYLFMSRCPPATGGPEFATG